MSDTASQPKPSELPQPDVPAAIAQLDRLNGRNRP